MNEKRLYRLLVAVGLLLLIPFIASQFTSEVQWDLFDYLVAGILLLGAGVLLNMILLKVKKPTRRVLFIVALLVVCILIWVELAVGIFNSPFSGD